MTPGQKLRHALASEKVVFAPLTLDALTGRIAERAGFSAGYISGGALGFAHGVSEALLTLTEIADVTQHVTARDRRWWRGFWRRRTHNPNDSGG